MPSEKWTPRFGQLVKWAGPESDRPTTCEGVIIATPDLSIWSKHYICEVVWSDGIQNKYWAHDLEPAPDPAATKLLKAAQYFRNGYESFLGMTVESEHADFIDSFAAKGGAE